MPSIWYKHFPIVNFAEKKSTNENSKVKVQQN